MRKLMSVPAVCEATGLKAPTIRAWATARRIASVKLGKRLLIPRDEVEKLIEDNLRPARSGADETAA
jgi:excisionase family DNA binding protein